MIYFVRRGSTDWNENVNALGQKDPRNQGRVDIPLNEIGIKQAKQTAKALKGVKFDKVICSPLRRARQTCEIVNESKVPVEIDERLIERDFGEFEGFTRTEFDFNGFWNTNSNQHFKTAESVYDVKKRVFDLLDELKQYPNENILIVSHGGVGCVFMSYFKGEPKDGNYLCYLIPNGKPEVLDF